MRGPFAYPPASTVARHTPFRWLRTGQLALLVSFVNLLASFLGERLTVQVLCQIWPDVAPILRPKKELP